MSFTPIALDKLPAPNVIAQVSFEEIFAAMKADFTARAPEAAAVLDLESDPVVKLLQVCAYREMLARAQANDQARGCMLAFATGADLDHLGALFGVARLVLDVGDPDALPPVLPTLEADTDFRDRIQLAPESFSVAGPEGAYIALARRAHPQVKDVSVFSPAPGEVDVTVLTAEGDGTPSPEVLDAVRELVTDPDRRPLGDAVTVAAPTILTYAVEAVLTLRPGPDDAVVRTAAETALAGYVAERHRLDNDIAVSGILAALHQPGVQNVQLISPAADLVVGPREAAFCTGLSVTVGGRDV